MATFLPAGIVKERSLNIGFPETYWKLTLRNSINALDGVTEKGTVFGFVCKLKLSNIMKTKQCNM